MGTVADEGMSNKLAGKQNMCLNPFFKPMLEGGGFFDGNARLHSVLGCKKLTLCLLSAPPACSNNWCRETGQYSASKVFVWHRLDSSRPPARPILFHRAKHYNISSIEKSHHQLEVMHEGSQSWGIGGKFLLFLKIPHEKPLVVTFS